MTAACRCRSLPTWRIPPECWLPALHCFRARFCAAAWAPACPPGVPSSPTNRPGIWCPTCIRSNSSILKRGVWLSHRNKTRPNHRNTGLVWPLLAFGVILVVAAIVLLGRQGDSAGTPRVAVDTNRIEYGYVKFGETRAFEVRVTNTGDGVLRFKEKPYIEVLEGC